MSDFVNGVKVDKRKIDIGEPIRETGIRTISVWLYSGVTTPMQHFPATCRRHPARSVRIFL